MKNIFLAIIAISGLLVATACFAQQYSIQDLGTLGGNYTQAYGLNESGQVVGSSQPATGNPWHHFRTAPNHSIDETTNDLGALGGPCLWDMKINASGQIIGCFYATTGTRHVFRTGTTGPIDPATQDLGTLGGSTTIGYGLNDAGQVVGHSTLPDGTSHAFRTGPNKLINPATDDLSINIGGTSEARGINAIGQVVGTYNGHAFRTRPNSPINPETDDLGSLGGLSPNATAINIFGQVAGVSNNHLFRTAPNRAIDIATDDLGSFDETLDPWLEARAINASGQIVGEASLHGGMTHHPFLYNNDVLRDLNELLPPGSEWELMEAYGINDAGQISGWGWHGAVGTPRGFLLTPIMPYAAFVKSPLNEDGTSVFKSRRAVLPLKFTLTEDNLPTCALPAAKISVVRTAGGPFELIDVNAFRASGESGPNLRIDQATCQYNYNLAASSLGRGTYTVEVRIKGLLAGKAIFTLE